jgi:hypothetical protein
MKVSIPLTGTLISYNPIVGDLNDPVRPLHIDLGNVSWQLVSLDLEHDLALIEVTPADAGDFPTGKIDKVGLPIYEQRKLTDIEKQALLDKVKAMVIGKTADELYALTKQLRLKKP